MADWRDHILKHFQPKISRLTLVADPDGLLTEEGMLSAIRHRGFDLIPFDELDQLMNPKVIGVAGAGHRAPRGGQRPGRVAGPRHGDDRGGQCHLHRHGPGNPAAKLSMVL